MSLGYSRKELGKLHKKFYEERMEKNPDGEAFQRALMSMIKAILDVIDANNKKLEEEIKNLKKNSP
ncbi:Hypothetical protein LUCI_2100 [Lucifera butyrica]|uniref:Uncharacterized protein n=1 Tax=Lucifera butyrica TaxID=1351585 RepID=A0A498R9P9_9FIRM|nr:hypothetical protein [Lucifera butyrica]VBB06863.1 Hypothetical protein LUCI_2100 [Lucifera butyrica]